MKNEITAFKPTSDNWCGSYRLKSKFYNLPELVRIDFGRLPFEETYRVCAWGNDDLGMEMDFDNHADAHSMFVQVMLLKDVTMEALSNMGFVSA